MKVLVVLDDCSLECQMDEGKHIRAPHIPLMTTDSISDIVSGAKAYSQN